MKFLKRVWEAITLPFISIAVLIDESKYINEDVSWSDHQEKSR